MAQIRHARLRHSAHDSGERPRAVARDIFEQRKFAEVKTLEFAHAFSVPLGNGRQAELWRGRIRRHHKESAARADAFCKAGDRIPHLRDGLRSEEHTSELQSLMRISYAVFCLKKNKH